MQALTMEQMVDIEGGGCRAAIWRTGLSVGLKVAGLVAAAVLSGGAAAPIIAAIVLGDAAMAIALWGLVDACSS